MKINLSRGLSLSLLLAVQDVKQSYRRSKLGAIWITASTGLQIVALGVVFTTVFKSSQQDYLAYVSTGLILWVFVTGTINESVGAFTASEGIVRQIPLRPSVHINRVVMRNLIILAHNIVLLPAVFLITGVKVDFLGMMFGGVGLALAVANVWWLAYLISLLGTRFRDVGPIVNSLLMVLFYVTPIMWPGGLLRESELSFLLTFNPFYHLVEGFRSPLLGGEVSVSALLVVLLMVLAGSLIGFLTVRKMSDRIPFWL